MNTDIYKAIRAELKVAQFELEELDCPEELLLLKKILNSMHLEQKVMPQHLKELEQLTKSLWDQGFIFEQALVHLDNAHQAMKSAL